MFKNVITSVQNHPPLVHCITNYVTVNDCANMILASGGSPIMADEIQEVCEITALCSSLVINMGTLNQRTVPSMIEAGKKSNQLGHPIIFDPVGAGASSFRNETAFKLLKEVQFSVIRGNISEIKFLAMGYGTTQGVDACEEDKITPENLKEVIALAQSFSQKTNAIIAITGAIDVIADSSRAFTIQNGHPSMSKITGTGCMLSALIGCYIGANPSDILAATVTAVTAMGIAGECAFEKSTQLSCGTGSLRTFILDFISQLDFHQLEENAKIESK